MKNRLINSCERAASAWKGLSCAHACVHCVLIDWYVDINETLIESFSVISRRDELTNSRMFITVQLYRALWNSERVACNPGGLLCLLDWNLSTWSIFRFLHILSLPLSLLGQITKFIPPLLLFNPAEITISRGKFASISSYPYLFLRSLFLRLWRIMRSNFLANCSGIGVRIFHASMCTTRAQRDDFRNFPETSVNRSSFSRHVTIIRPVLFHRGQVS